MNYSNQDLLNFVKKIKFTREDKAKYQNQIDNLIFSLSRHIKEKTDTKVLKVIQSGSWKKGTILKPKDGNPVDIDLVFFLDIEFNNYSTFQEINSLIVSFLKDIYPNKQSSDFWENPKTAGIEFRISGLNVDIVPVREVEVQDYVEQPDKDLNMYFTSPKGQLEFIKKRKEENTNFTSIVRMLKRWKNIKNLRLSSFSIELIAAYLDINKGVESDIQEALIRFFDFLSRKEIPLIHFNAPYGKIPINNDNCLVVIDPTYNENNTTKYLTQTDWKDIQDDAKFAFENIVYANELDYKNETLSLWKNIFGKEFSIDLLYS